MNILEIIISFAGFIFQLITVVCLFKNFRRIKELKEQTEKDHYILEHLCIKQEKANKEIIEEIKRL